MYVFCRHLHSVSEEKRWKIWESYAVSGVVFGSSTSRIKVKTVTAWANFLEKKFYIFYLIYCLICYVVTSLARAVKALILITYLIYFGILTTNEYWHSFKRVIAVRIICPYVPSSVPCLWVPADWLGIEGISRISTFNHPCTLITELVP
jgi:hypothetical protein